MASQPTSPLTYPLRNKALLREGRLIGHKYYTKHGSFRFEWINFIFLTIKNPHQVYNSLPLKKMVLVGGNSKIFGIFTPLPGKMIQFDGSHIFQNGLVKNLHIVVLGVFQIRLPKLGPGNLFRGKLTVKDSGGVKWKCSTCKYRLATGFRIPGFQGRLADVSSDFGANWSSYVATPMKN